MSLPTKVLALDVATRTGWALSNGLCGYWDLREYADEGGGMRLVRLAAKLREIRKAWGLELLVYEDVTVQSGARANARAQKFLAQALGVVRLFCEEGGIPYEAVNLNTIKSHALGGKRGKKEDVLAAARARWGDESVPDDNVADALWLLDYALDKFALPKPPDWH